MTNQNPKRRTSAERIRTDSTIKSAKPKEKEYTLTDGRGLHLLVKPTGAKLWRFRYTHGGKQKIISLGSYPAVSLAQARKLREEHHADLANGICPAEKRQQQKSYQEAETLTFRIVAERWFHIRSQVGPKLWSPATAVKVRRCLDNELYPYIGDKPIKSIQRRDLVSIRDRLTARGTHSLARDIRSWYLPRIFAYAMDQEWIDASPAVNLGVGEGAARAEAKSLESIDFKHLPELMAAIEASNAHILTQYFIKLLALIACRPSELRLAKWPEFDMKNAIWSIPAERMKMRRSHSVPLPRQAIEILKRIKAIRPDGFLFVVQGDKPISSASINNLLRRLTYTGKQTAHGFRHLLSTELHARGYNPDWIESQLAHKVAGIRGVYNQADYLEQRRGMMQEWANSLDDLREGTPLHVAAKS